MNQEIYLDNAATTRVLPQVTAAMEPYLAGQYGNASTDYQLGRKARQAIEDARARIAEVIDARASEIYFTSGGSESDNWAIKSIAGEFKRSGKHIITSQIEHHAVLNSCDYLKKLGYKVTYLPVDGFGMVEPEQLQEAITKETTLITIMYGNNEIGTIQPVGSIGMIARKHNIAFHTDAVQAVGQIPISVRREPIDLLSASAHKFHGPKGVGFLYVREGIPIPSFIHGGSQEKGKRAGTENVPGIVGMGEALWIAANNMWKNRLEETRLRNYFIERILREIPDVRLNGHPYLRLPGNVNISFHGLDATSLLVLLEEENICASAGSACSTGEARISHVIEAIHVPEEYAPGTIRFSLGTDTTREEIDRALHCLKQDCRLLRDKL